MTGTIRLLATLVLSVVALLASTDTGLIGQVRARDGECGYRPRRFSSECFGELNRSKKIGTGKMPENRQ